MEEVRPVVRGRAHVELVARQEPLAIAGQQGLRRIEEIRLVEQVVAVGLRGGHAGVVGEIEGALTAEFLQRGEAGGAEVAVADQ
ncbi:hypothetical protein D3C78_1440190 [compost metagenome]